MKYVYVLTSNEKDYYCEQCIVSMTSLLRYNPCAEIILLVDDITYKTLTNFRVEVIKLSSKIIVKCFSKIYTQKIRSRLLKTSMRKYVDGEFVFLDLDTVVAGALEGLEKVNADIAMVLDKHMLLSEQCLSGYYMNLLSKRVQRIQYHAGYADKHFNSGVIYVNDSMVSYYFFNLWHKLYLETLKSGIDIDQISLNEANARMKGVILELDGVWNVQADCGLKYISEAKIIHYFGSYFSRKERIKYADIPPFQLCDKRYFDEMKSKNCITNEIDEIINYPKKAFKTAIMISEDCIKYSLFFSSHIRILKFLYVKFYGIYIIFENVYSGLLWFLHDRKL